jgi:hypothetical protein
VVVLGDSHGEEAEQRVPVRRAEHPVDKAAARPQHAANVAEGLGGVGHKHQAEAGDHRIDAGVGQVDGLGVHRPAFDIGEPPGLGAPAGSSDHAVRQVGGDQAAAGKDALGG